MTSVLAERIHERVPADDPLAICEAAALASPIQADGTVLMHVIRPGIGRGRGGHYYPPEMLRENAHVFVGARMFLDHETEKQRRERGHLPRPVEHLAGRILESWWDESVPADDRFEQGAVTARVMPRRVVKEMIEDDPQLLEVSINALATGKHMGRHPTGRSVPIVEGIRAKPLTVDFISGEGGAGGRILLESESDDEEAVLESLTDDEFEEYLRENRPEFLSALRDPRGGNDDRRRENDVPETITAEALTEALASDDGKAVLLPIIQEAFSTFEPPKAEIDEDAIERIVEARMAERSDLLTIEARNAAHRRTEVGQMREKALALIEASKLHPKLKEKLVSEFSLLESGEPSPALDVKPELDAEGNVVKTALALLEESVKHEIDDALELQGVLGTRTRVRGQGSTGKTRISLAELQESKEVDEEGKPVVRKPKASTGSPLTDTLLESAGVPTESLDKLWATA